MSRRHKLSKALASAIKGAELGSKNPEPTHRSAQVHLEDGGYRQNVREEAPKLEEAARYAFEHHEELYVHQQSISERITREARARGETPEPEQVAPLLKRKPRARRT